MWKLRVKIDVWSKGLDETLRQRNRDLLIEGPEDTIAQGKCLVSIVYLGYINFEVACHIVRPEKLAQLMYKATMNDVQMRNGQNSISGLT